MNSTKKINWRNRTGLLLASLLVSGSVLAVAWKAPANTPSKVAKTFESHVGHGRINIVDFRGAPGSGDQPFVFRLEFTSFESVPTDGFFGPVTKGKMTFSYPRQNNPAVAYNPAAAETARLTQGPAYGETVDYQAREIAPNVFEVHWKEPRRGDTVTHVEDFNRQQVCTNIANINRVPIPAGFDPLDLTKQLNNPELFPDGNPVAKSDFPYFSLCGKMRQSLAADKVWENELHMLVYEAPK